MPKLILASRSLPRQKLLEQLGLKFAVAVSNVPEARSSVKGREKLAIENAVRKARAVASRYTSGIIIGADTVAFVGKKTIGKPRSLRDAEKTLILLSRRPQWIYTGLAVIDAATGKTATACEKTKVYMRRMDPEQIRAYFKKVSPLDKAGAFDIQGLGGAFVERIEGCFYNVVGLPLARLAIMLKEFNVNIF